MKTYIVLTTGGYTEDNSGNETFNCQVICTVDAIDEQAAIGEAMKIDYERGHDFPVDSYIAYEIV